MTPKVRVGILVAMVLVCGVPSVVHADPVLTTGFDPAAVLAAGTRLRNFLSSGTGNREIRVGLPPLTTDSSMGLADVTWGTSKCVQFSYDGTTLTVKVAAAASPCSFTTLLATATKSVGSLGALNYIQIQITKNGGSNSVAFQNPRLGATALSTTCCAVTGGADTQYWNITGEDVSGGFSLVGTVALNSLSGGGDSSFIELSVGFVEPPDDEGPITSNLVVSPVPVIVNGPATFSADVDDSITGASTIGSAHYTLDGGPPQPMDAAGGAFDEISEGVTVTITNMPDVGKHTVCVYGTDSVNNIGDPVCDDFYVTYIFTGFFSPIDNELLNTAKAGQAIPAKWRLTDADGVGITNSGSFAGMFSYLIDCESLAGEIADAVEEYASGESGLQNLGDGYWQFNWKTVKTTYADTCRAMYLGFDSETISSVVTFQFKR